MTAIQSNAQTWLPSGATIRRIVNESPGVKTFDLSLDDDRFAASYRWLPGQFNMLYVPGIGEAAISISGSDLANRLVRHTIRRVGWVTDAIDRMEVGATIGIRGPFGSSWPLEEMQNAVDDATCDVIVLAGGIGLVPLRPLILKLLSHRDRIGELTVLAGSRTPEDLLFGAEYASWKKRGIVLQTTVDRMHDHWQGHVGVVTLLLERIKIRRPESTYVMICGPDVMMRYATECALHRDIPPENLWLSLERHMNCAVGLCGHCQIGPVFVCKDGPVFRYDRVAPWLHVQGF